MSENNQIEFVADNKKEAFQNSSQDDSVDVNLDVDLNIEAISDNEAKNKIDSLRKEIEHHTYLYYSQDNPSISDYAYDSLMRTLRRLEEAFPQYRDSSSPTMRVGGYVGEQFSPVQHQVKMYSLDNAMDLEELDA